MLGGVLALLLAGAPPPTVAAPPSASLAVESEPAGARVYLDGAFVGFTPFVREGLAPGRHRVVVTKDGYLENARSVELRASAVERLAVRLTERPPGEARGAQDEEAQAGGGRTWPWIAAGVVAVGAAAGAAAALSGNRGPSAGVVVVEPPGTGLAAATEFTFTLSGAGDPDADPIDVAWDFGDGASASGETARHTFTRAGSFTVVATVSDAESSATTSLTVAVRDLAGAWAALVTTGIGPVPVQLTLAQSGTALSGSYADEDGPGTVAGSVSAPRRVVLTVSQSPFLPFTFTGTADGEVALVTGTVEGLPFVMTRR